MGACMKNFGQADANGIDDIRTKMAETNAKFKFYNVQTVE